MNYFQVVAIAFGGILILVRPIMHLFPKRWAEFEMSKAYTERQPAWVWLAGLLGIALVAYTWYRQITTPIPYSIIITLAITLTLVKLSQVLFNYKQFRAFAEKALTRERSVLAKITIATVLLGVVLVSLGVWVL